jgi:hypothetical protein
VPNRLQTQDLYHIDCFASIPQKVKLVRKDEHCLVTFKCQNSSDIPWNLEGCVVFFVRKNSTSTVHWNSRGEMEEEMRLGPT